MSLKAIKKAVAQLHETNPYRRKAMAEIAALEKAAKDLTRLHLGDGADHVAHREHVIQAMTDDPESQWNHPDVVAWGEAAVLLATIAKEAE